MHTTQRIIVVDLSVVNVNLTIIDIIYVMRPPRRSMCIKQSALIYSCVITEIQLCEVNNNNNNKRIPLNVT